MRYLFFYFYPLLLGLSHYLAFISVWKAATYVQLFAYSIFFSFSHKGYICINNRSNSSRHGKKNPYSNMTNNIPSRNLLSKDMYFKYLTLSSGIPLLIPTKPHEWAITLVSWHAIMCGWSSFYFLRTMLILCQSTAEMISTTDIL